MHIHYKIQKHKNVTYYFGLNQKNSKYGTIICDFEKVEKAKDRLNNYSEAVVAWVNMKSKAIEWEEQAEEFIDKDFIKAYVIHNL